MQEKDLENEVNKLEEAIETFIVIVYGDSLELDKSLPTLSRIANVTQVLKDIG